MYLLWISPWMNSLTLGGRQLELLPLNPSQSVDLLRRLLPKGSVGHVVNESLPVKDTKINPQKIVALAARVRHNYIHITLKLCMCASIL